MNKQKKNNSEFVQIVSLIDEARSRAFQKVNEELVQLHFKVGNIISTKVSEGIWGDGTVNELANYIETSHPELKGFNRRGLYRMKQFFETYSDKKFVSPLATQLDDYFSGNYESVKVSALPTQSEQFIIQRQKLVELFLCKVTWTNHLEILSQTKSSEEKFFYLLQCIKEKWSMRDLRRQFSRGI